MSIYIFSPGIISDINILLSIRYVCKEDGTETVYNKAALNFSGTKNKATIKNRQTFAARFRKTTGVLVLIHV